MPGSMRTALLVDGAHYDRIRRSLAVRIDLEQLRRFATGDGILVSATFYRDLRDRTEAERLQGLLDWLGRHGYVAKGRHHPPSGDRPKVDRERRERYGTNLVELAVDAMGCIGGGCDHIVLMAADAKLVPLVSALQSCGIQVTVLSTAHAPTAIAVARELREMANCYFDLDKDRHVAGVESLPGRTGLPIGGGGHAREHG